ncbi:N-acetyltransferase family protein [Thermovenabulum sp.]|uniref:GNAT family N-acetyltransferase n=1 Tax=Thermovenabulum sp. TaxID=3100335 RepID=UPI003C7D6407
MKILAFIRPAKENEALILSELAEKSEGHWGYDEKYMVKFKEKYRLTEEYIKNFPVFVLEDKEKILGFFGLLFEKDEVNLEFFYIDTDYIGKGYGRMLWSHLADYCKEKGIKSFTFVTSPEAKGFYIKMGAEYLGEVESSVKKGRIIPRLIYYVK